MSEPPTDRGALLTVKQLAELLNCSKRHVYRLTDRGALPQPVRLGALVRWNRTQIEQWIVSGCPSCRQGGRRDARSAAYRSRPIE